MLPSSARRNARKGWDQILPSGTLDGRCHQRQGFSGPRSSLAPRRGTPKLSPIFFMSRPQNGREDRFSEIYELIPMVGLKAQRIFRIDSRLEGTCNMGRNAFFLSCFRRPQMCSNLVQNNVANTLIKYHCQSMHLL